MQKVGQLVVAIRICWEAYFFGCKHRKNETT